MNYRMILISAGFILHSQMCFGLLHSAPMLPPTSLSISEAGNPSQHSVGLSGESVAASWSVPQDTDKDKQPKEAPVEFTYKISAFVGTTRVYAGSSGRPFENRLEVEIRNNDPARTIVEVEYEIYSTNIKSNAEVDHIPLKDRTKIKPNGTKKRRSLRWETESIRQKCKPVTDCQLWVRIRNI
ncbi:MAG: hypothetical protein L0229_32115, partial [Blastocatellia bacterium]|nr:hypothetical protein [Blastocatellia bacterium]